MFVLLFAISSPVLSASVLSNSFGDATAETEQLVTKTLHETLIEELHGAHLRIAATNVRLG